MALVATNKVDMVVHLATHRYNPISTPHSSKAALCQLAIALTETPLPY